jgi:hypothetical protein
VEEFSKRYEKTIAKTKSIIKYTCNICKKYYPSDKGLSDHKQKSKHCSPKDKIKNMKNL